METWCSQDLYHLVGNRQTGGYLQLQRFSPKRERSKFHIRLPRQESCTRKMSPLIVWLSRLAWLTCRRPRGLWEMDSTLECTQNLHTLWDPGQRQEFERSLGQMHLWRATQGGRRQWKLIPGAQTLAAAGGRLSYNKNTGAGKCHFGMPFYQLQNWPHPSGKTSVVKTNVQ